jgi:hypothetical protein
MHAPCVRFELEPKDHCQDSWYKQNKDLLLWITNCANQWCNQPSDATNQANLNVQDFFFKPTHTKRC